jgi:uncharacterized protein YbjT (DUF2867 family)
VDTPADFKPPDEKLAVPPRLTRQERIIVSEFSFDQLASPSTDRATAPLVAVTGASGYVGGRLVPALLEVGYRVRCIVREPRKLDDRAWRHHPSVTVERNDLSDADKLVEQLSGCEYAYYLVHSMGATGKAYAEQDRKIAAVFADAAAKAGVKRIVYLGGLGEHGSGLSEHLVSRREVEKVLGSTGIPVTAFRAAMIIGSGSASFEILRYLVERLPVMVTPSWVKTESQPVAIADVLHWLVRCLAVPQTAGKVLEIGGSDIQPYRELMRIMAEELGIPRRIIIPLPVLTPRLSSGWISLVTPVSYRIARPLADGLRNRVVVTNELVQQLMPHDALSSREAIRRALVRIRNNTVDTRWSVAGPVPGDPDWAGGTVFLDERKIVINAEPHRVFQAVCRIGGGHGWYAGDVLWRIRGWMDTLVGGPGLRRGRRDHERVEFGETLDFWRIVGLERDRRLSLLAEMKLPGIATLNFEMVPGKSANSTALTMAARFRPRGIVGIAYWYCVLPLHNLVFGGMLRGIQRVAEGPASSSQPPQLENSQHSDPTNAVVRPKISGYGRARLWLGISAVGTMVTLATAALLTDLPARLATQFESSFSGQMMLIVAFLLAYAAVQLPFDILGGYALPRRYGRHHPPPLQFALGLLRGIAAHIAMLTLSACALLLAGHQLGIWGVIGTSIAIVLVLLAGRLQVARLLAPLRGAPDSPAVETNANASVPVQSIRSEDEGFTGGIVGVLRPRRILLPELWSRALGESGLAVVKRRRELAISSGSWWRGRVLAVLFTLTGVAIAAAFVGPERIATGHGIVTMSLLFTLWSFLGLLTLPTFSRAGVAEVDAKLRAAGMNDTLINNNLINDDLIDDTIRKLDALQDAEPLRPVGVETIFHPVPSVNSRLAGPVSAQPWGYLDAARTSVYLSAAGLGLLGRAVHCNCGRPALWAFLPSD